MEKCPDCLGWLISCPACEEFFCAFCGLTEQEAESRAENEVEEDFF